MLVYYVVTMKQNKQIANQFQHLEGITTGEAARISERSRKADVEEAARLKALFSTPEQQPVLSAGDEFEQRIMRGPSEADLREMQRDEDAHRWQEREMSPEELAEQEKWDAFAHETAVKAVRSHRIVVKEKKAKPERIHVNILPMTPGMSATEHMLSVNSHFHHEHNSGQVDRAS